MKGKRSGIWDGGVCIKDCGGGVKPGRDIPPGKGGTGGRNGCWREGALDGGRREGTLDGGGREGTLDGGGREGALDGGGSEDGGGRVGVVTS